MQKFIFSADWLQKGIRYGPAKLDNRLFQNVQDVQQSHKVNREKPWKTGKSNWQLEENV